MYPYGGQEDQILLHFPPFSRRHRRRTAPTSSTSLIFTGSTTKSSAHHHLLLHGRHRTPSTPRRFSPLPARRSFTAATAAPSATSPSTLPPPPLPSASLTIRPPKLCTILSGKEAPSEDPFAGAEPVAPAAGGSETKSYGRWGQRGGRRRRKKKEKSKSLTDLEFEELKGLVDLGFTFSDAETDPRLLEIVPALQRLGLGRNRASEEEAAPAAPVDAAVSRPYLSEAWEVAEAKPEERLLMNLIPAGVAGADLKGQLRSWAHAVASTVR